MTKSKGLGDTIHNVTKITGIKIWLKSHVFGEANPDNSRNIIFFFYHFIYP